MGATFLMSYPGPNWQIRGAANFRSESRSTTNPRAAMVEWLSLADAITRAGGRILVMPPTDPSLTGMVYTANAGHMFKNGDEWLYVVSKMAVAHRQPEQARIKAFLSEAGVPVREAKHTWEGQAEVCTFTKGSRYILTWGVRSVRESIEEIRGYLPRGSRSKEIQLHEPWFHGDTCLNPLVNRAGDTHLLAFGGALVSSNIPEIRNFLDKADEVISVDEDDARAYVCNALCIDGTVLMAEGSSSGLRGTLIHRGYMIEELNLPELFGKGGGGPRCMVNELRGFVLTDDAPSYVQQREHLQALVSTYPESLPGEPAKA